MLQWILTVLLLVFSFTSIGFAESQKWLDDKYDFKQVKRVMLLSPELYSVELDEITTKQLRQIYFAEVSLKDVVVLEEQQILDVIASREDKSIEQLADEDAVGLYRMFEEEAKQRADVIVFPYIAKYEKGSKHIPEQTTTKTEYEEVVVKDKNDDQNTVRYPVTRTEVVPAKDIVTLTVSVMFRAIDVQTGKEILLYEDQRYREPTDFEEHTPINMYKRIVKKFSKDFSALLK